MNDLHISTPESLSSPKKSALPMTCQEAHTLDAHGTPPTEGQPARQLTDLPEEILIAIGHYLGQHDRFQWGQTHPQLRSTMHSPRLLPQPQLPLSRALSQQAEHFYAHFQRRAAQFGWPPEQTSQLAHQAVYRLAEFRQHHRLSTGRYREILIDPKSINHYLGCSLDGRFALMEEKRQSRSGTLFHRITLYDITCQPPARYSLFDCRQFVGAHWFSTDSRWLIMNEWFGRPSPQVWDLHHLERHPVSLPIESSDLQAIEFLPEHHQIITIEKYKTHQKWDLNTLGAQQDQSLNDTSSVKHVTFDNDGRHMIKHFSDNRRVVWDFTHWPVKKTLLDTRPELIQFIRFSADSTHCIAQSEQQPPRLWDLQQSPPLCKPLTHPHTFLHDAVFSANNQWLVTQITGENLCLWDTRQEQPRPHILQSTRQVVKTWIEFSPNNQWLFIPSQGLEPNRSSQAICAQLWYLPKSCLQPIPIHAWIPPKPRLCQTSIFSPDSQWLVTVTEKKTIQLWRLAPHQLIPTIQLGRQINHVWFSPDNTKCYALNTNMQIIIFDFS